MQRDKAFSLIKEHIKNKNLISHSLAVEACMRAMSDYLNEDKEEWGMAGLLHDLDYEYTVEDPDNHTIKSSQMLMNFDVSNEIIHAIKAHNFKVEPVSKMDWALLSVDPTTGFIIAVALMHPTKSLEAANIKRMKKRFKEGSFAKGASRDQIKNCEKLGLDLDKFLILCRDAMSGIHTQLGL